MALATVSTLSVASNAACCSSLRDAFRGSISFPGESAFNATEVAYWSLQETNIQPACIMHPQTAQDVAHAISIISSTPDCDLAIKGGGHSPAAGFANVDGGVTIDMTSLASIQLSSDSSFAMVEAGAKWLDVYNYLNNSQLAVAGGRNGLVGVGGLLLGGGISHFSPKVGWASDGVTNYEIVLGNGSFVNANSTRNQDLFRALKGGASNFGVVTRFDLVTFPQGDLSVTSIVFDVAQRGAVFEAFTEITNASVFDVDTSLVTSLLYNSTSRSWIVSSSAVYTEPVLHPVVYRNLTSIPNLQNKSIITPIANFANEAPTPPLYWLFATSTFRPSAQLMLEIFDTLNTTLYSFNPEGGIVWSVAFEPLAGALVSDSDETQGGVFGSVKKDTGFIILISALWPDNITDQVEEVARCALSAIEDKANSHGLLQKFQYVNYAAPTQRPLHSYGEHNLEFLRSVSKKYDPQEVFQRRVRGGFKLW